MSTATEVSRLTSARNTIRDKLIAMGLAASADKLDALASAIDGISIQGAVSATVQEGATYTIPAGYHNGSGTVSGIAGGGNYGLQSKNVTPTKSQQSITPDSGYYGLSDVTVAAIPEAYQNVSAVTATASELLSPKVFVNAQGSSVVGTMVDNGAVSATLTVAAPSYTVPVGYHNGSGKVQISLESKSATPSTSAQTITPTTGKVLSSVAVAAIPSAYQDVTGVTATAAQVLTGAKFIDATGSEITGNMSNNGAVSVTLSTATTSYTVPTGYHNGSGTVSVTLETKSATPSTSAQTITPTTGKVLSSVSIAAIPAAYQNVTNVTATASQVLSGAVFVNASGSEVEGTMANNSAISGTINGLTTTSYTVPSGYTSGGTVSLTSDIEDALAAI